MSSAYMLSTIAAIFGCWSRSVFSKSSPLLSGRLMSSSATSKACWRTSLIASAAFSASPVTSTSSAAPSIRRMPLRATVWSSTSSTLILLSVMLYLLRHAQNHFRAASGCAGDAQFPAQIAYPFMHSHDTPAAVPGQARGFDALAVVLQFDDHRIVLAVCPKRRRRCLRMAHDVRQRLLDDAKHCRAALGIELDLQRARIDLHRARQAAAGFDLFGIPLDRRPQAELVEHARTQVGDDAPHG